MKCDACNDQFTAIHIRIDAMQRRIMRYEKHQEKQQASIGWLTKRWAAAFNLLKRRVKK